MAKIKINNLPEGFTLENGQVVEQKKDGGSLTTGDQFNWGLVTVPTNAAYGTELNDSDTPDVRYSLSSVPRDEANIEAEGGETVLTDLNGDGMFGLYDIEGPRHGSGGVPMYLPEQSFVFSDTTKMKFNKSEMAEFGIESKKKKTPAKISKKFELNKYYKNIVDPYTDNIGLRSAELMLDKNKRSLSKLAFGQEAKKDWEDGVPLAAHPYIVEQGMDPIEFTAKVEELGMQQAQNRVLEQLSPEQREQVAMVEQMLQQQAMQQQAATSQDPSQQPEQMGTPPMQGMPGMDPMSQQGMPPQQMMPPMDQGAMSAPMPMAQYGYELPEFQLRGEKVGPIATEQPIPSADGIDLIDGIQPYIDGAASMGLTAIVVDARGQQIDPNNAGDGMYEIKFVDQYGNAQRFGNQPPMLFGVQQGQMMMSDPSLRQATHNEIAAMIQNNVFSQEDLADIQNTMEIQEKIDPREQPVIENINPVVQTEGAPLMSAINPVSGEEIQMPSNVLQQNLMNVADTDTDADPLTANILANAPTPGPQEETVVTEKTTETVEEPESDTYSNPAVSDVQRTNLNNAIKLDDFTEVQKVLEANIGNVVDGKAGPTNQPAGTFAKYDGEGELEGDMRSGNSKMGIQSLFPELKANPNLMGTANGELMRMFNVNSGFDPRVAAGIAQGLIPSEDRSKYWSKDGKPAELDINDVKGINLAEIDPGRLLEEVTDIYKNTSSDTYPIDPATGMSTNYPVWQERIKFLSERHGLDYPEGFTEKGDFRTQTIREVDDNGNVTFSSVKPKNTSDKFFTYDKGSVSKYDAYDPDEYNGAQIITDITNQEKIEDKKIENKEDVNEVINELTEEYENTDNPEEKKELWDELNDYKKLEKVFASENAQWVEYLDKAYAGYNFIVDSKDYNPKGVKGTSSEDFQKNVLMGNAINLTLRDLKNQDSDLGRKVAEGLKNKADSGYWKNILADEDVQNYLKEYTGLNPEDAIKWASDKNNIMQFQAGMQGFRKADAEDESGMEFLGSEFAGTQGEKQEVYDSDAYHPSKIDGIVGDHTATSVLLANQLPPPPPGLKDCPCTDADGNVTTTQVKEDEECPPCPEPKEEPEPKTEIKKGCPCSDGSVSYLCCAKAPEARWEPWLQDEILLNTNPRRDMFMPWQPDVERVELDYVLDDPTTQIAANNAAKAISDQAAGAFGGRQGLAAFTGKSAGEAMDANAKALQRVQTNNVNIKNQYFRDQAKLDAQTNLERRNRNVKYVDDVNRTLQNYQNERNMDDWNYAQKLASYYTNAANTQAMNAKNPYYHVMPGQGGTVRQVGKRSFTGDKPTADKASYQEQYKNAYKELQEIAGSDGKVTNTMINDYLRGAPAPTKGTTNNQGYPGTNVYNYNTHPNMMYTGYGPSGFNQTQGYPGGANVNVGGGGRRPIFNNQGQIIGYAKKGKELKKWARPFYTGKMGV